MLVLATGLLPSLAGQVDATFDAQTGRYQVVDRMTGWTLGGSIGGPAAVRTEEGRDGRGAYRELRFDWTEGATPLEGAIRIYQAAPAVLFRLDYPEGKKAKSTVFPNFTQIPKRLHPLSYRDVAFSPATFGLMQTSTPWLLFDDQYHAMIMSPASGFMIAKMVGDENSSLGMALNDRLGEVPKGYRQECLVTFGDGIGKVWRAWGESLRSLYHRQPAPTDPITEKFGYWTDNGADYYYRYDLDKGYAGTMLSLADRYRAAGYPLGYLQLDSWWYRKLMDKIAGDKSPERKNPDLPAEDWNRYGGILEYRASPELFPDGLAAFHQKLDLPIIVHGRWIDRNSPLRQRYDVVGVGAVDRRYWDDVAGYLKSGGVICYEQDWIENIYASSPEMAGVAGVADRFADGMAQAMAAKGLSMQYCMATPRFFLQGVKYPNLATVRTTTDRFEPRRWAQFVLGAPFVEGIGARPWCDVFRSREKGNLIVSLLSAGPVGTGDAMGVESADNIRKVARTDAVLVKPDHSIVPTDETYLNEALKNGKPFVGWTSTDHGLLRTRYYFAFPRNKEDREVRLDVGRAYLYNFVSGEGRLVDGVAKVATGADGYGYWQAAPVTRSGIALLGDLAKLVPTGKARIASIQETTQGMRVRLAFAAGEGPVTLEGYGAKPMRAAAVAGTVLDQRYDEKTKRFAVRVKPDGTGAELTLLAG